MTDAMPALDTLAKNLHQAFSADRHRLRRQLHELRKKPDEGKLAQWLERFQASVAKVEARRQSVPAIRYDDALPIAAKRDEIKAALEKYQIVVIAGETGSGKTTQLRRSAWRSAAASTAFITAMLVLYGIGLTLGNMWGGKAADRSVDRTLIVSLSALILVLLAFTVLMRWPS